MSKKIKTKKTRLKFVKRAGKSIIYNCYLTNPIPPAANDFIQYTKSHISGGRSLIDLTLNNTAVLCQINLTMTCWSTNIKDFGTSILTEYPLATITFTKVGPNKRRA